MNDPVIVSKIALNLEKEGESFGFLFYRAGQVYSHALQQHLSGKAAGSLTSLQIELLLQLCKTPMRMSALADTMSMSKQALGQLVRNLEAKGYVTRKGDETDGRAKTLTHTPKALEILEDLHTASLAAEQDLARIAGPFQFRELRKTLTNLVQSGEKQ